ncbi:MAG: hypothetical protein IKQ46_00890 [Bacteroidales bacterium]|nr:hypothetical protein [Bacteroidales bacterium]
MKSINFLFLVCLLTAFTLCVTSCSKEDKNNDEKFSENIVGIWDVTNSETYIDEKTEKEYFIDLYSNYKADWNLDGEIDELDIFDPEVISRTFEGEKPVESYLEFKADGNAVFYSKYEDGNEDKDKVKYEISDNKLYISDEEDDVKEYEFSIKGNTLTLTANDEWDSEIDGKTHTRRSITTLTKR